MKVLHINCTDKGSTGKLIKEINDRLIREGDQGFICHALGNETDEKSYSFRTAGRYEPGINNRITKITGIPYGFAFFSTYKTKRIILRLKPDIIHLHCPNNDINIYNLIIFLKKNNFPLLITNHCEMFYTGNCPHAFDCKQWKKGCEKCLNSSYINKYLFDNTKYAWNLLYKSLANYNNIKIVSVSKWVFERSKSSLILGKYPNIIIENGVNTNIYHNYEIDEISLKNKYKIYNNIKIILFVTACYSLDPSNPKGGYFLNLLAKEVLSENILFIVAGKKADIISDVLPNIITIGHIDDEIELAKLYNIANLSIVLSKKETFSMPTAESLCCGTPVVGFKSGGPESIALKKYSCFCNYGDVFSLKKIILKWINIKTKDNTIIISEDARKRYDSELMFKKYYNLYKTMINI